MADDIQLVDTHCHIQFRDYGLDPAEAIENALQAGVSRLILVGCTLEDSRAAVEMAAKYSKVWASIGLHPHEGAKYVNDKAALDEFSLLASQPKVVAVGETGLDYYYNHSPKADQARLLKFQLDLAQKHDLPLIFHVREAFDDFWQIVDQYSGVRGVVHSFSSNTANLTDIIKRELYVGLNGIMTFTKDEQQLEAAKTLPLSKMLLETDAPFLTPKPFRGKIGEPKYVRTTAEFLSELRSEKLTDLAAATTENAKTLFKLV